MRNLIPLLAVACLAPTIARAEAVVDKYHITPEERAACSADAMTLCSTAYPDEDKLLVCMRASRASLTPGCRTVFEAGLRRRHLDGDGPRVARTK